MREAGSARPSRWIALLALLVLAPLAIAPSYAASDVMPFEEVKAGMKGIGRTVFTGDTIEEFDVEVIATMRNVLPKKNIIVARLKGGPLAQSGVLEGMSGSPVFLDGKFAGAVSYAFGFAKEPFCGITPADEMLALLDRGGDAGSNPAAGGGSAEPPAPRLERTAAPADAALLAWPARLAAFFQDRQRLMASHTAAASGALRPMTPALVFGGFSSQVVDAWSGAFSALSMRPVIAGSLPPAAAGPASALKPGSSFGVSLVRGDLDVTAIGTVTWVAGDKILGLGHPFLGTGPTEMPMTSAYVYGYLPSLANSFKLAAPRDEIGAITQDRHVGVAGVLGRKVAMIPVRVEMTREDGTTRTNRFDIVPDPLLTPGLLHMALQSLLAGDEKYYGDVSLRLKEGSRIQLAGDLDVKLDNLFSGDDAALYASGTVAYMTYLLLNNEDRATRIEGINLLVDYADRRSVARIERIWLARYTARPGETISLNVELRPFREEPATIQIPLEIPEETAEGKVLLQVGDSLTLSRMETGGGQARFMPRSLEQIVWLLNNLRANQRVYATLIRPDTGAVISGERLPSLPPSVSSVLLRPGLEPDSATRVRIQAVLEESATTDHVVRGYQKAILEIRR